MHRPPSPHKYGPLSPFRSINDLLKIRNDPSVIRFEITESAGVCAQSAQLRVSVFRHSLVIFLPSKSTAVEMKRVYEQEFRSTAHPRPHCCTSKFWGSREKIYCFFFQFEFSCSRLLFCRGSKSPKIPVQMFMLNFSNKNIMSVCLAQVSN